MFAAHSNGAWQEFCLDSPWTVGSDESGLTHLAEGAKQVKLLLQALARQCGCL